MENTAAVATGGNSGGTTTTNNGGGTTITTPNAGGTNPASTQSAGGTTTATDWTTGFTDEIRGFVQNKGWKGPQDVIDSYRGTEKLLGAPQSEILRLPKDDDADGWNNVYNRLGRPADPKEYKLETPKEGGNEAFTKWAGDAFHGLGLTAKQAQGLAAKWNEYMGGAQKASVESFNAKAAQEVQGLQKEWGAAYEQNKSIATRACREFGIDAPTLDKLESVLGTAGVVKMMHNIGSKVGESAFVAGNGGSGNGVMTPAQAQAQIATLRNDNGFVKKLSAGDASAKSQWNRLHEMANPGEMTI